MEEHPKTGPNQEADVEARSRPAMPSPDSPPQNAAMRALIQNTVATKLYNQREGHRC